MATYSINGSITLQSAQPDSPIVRLLGGEDAQPLDFLSNKKIRTLDVIGDDNYEVLSETELSPIVIGSSEGTLKWSFRDNFTLDLEGATLRFEVAELNSDDYLFAFDDVSLPTDGGTITTATFGTDSRWTPDAGALSPEMSITVRYVQGLESIVEQGVEAVSHAAQNLSEIIRKGVEGIEKADALQNTSREVKLRRSDANATDDQALWVLIRQRTRALGFGRYRRFVNQVFCASSPQNGPKSPEELRERSLTPGTNFANLYLSNVDAYQLLKVTTDAFLILNASGSLSLDQEEYEADALSEQSRLNGPTSFEEMSSLLRKYLGDSARLPYLKRILDTLNELDTFEISTNGEGEGEKLLDTGACEGLVTTREDLYMIELIWSFWHEEAGLVQALNAISMRFQNRRLGKRDPLADLAVDPLRPLNNLLWGYVQDEPHRLSVPRRAYEYDHQYGLRLVGKAVPEIQAVDSRSKFLAAFHNLLYLASVFYREDDETTVIADAYRLLRALIDVHILIAAGSHNQYGALPFTARSEMLQMQWLLQRDEMLSFLRGRVMVPQQEAWMGPVETMRRLQNWGDTPVKHFRDLAVFAEQLLLSIRLGDWIEAVDQEQAKNWARYWRPEIQGYLYAYQAATGVDLAADGPAPHRALQPSVLLRQRTASPAPPPPKRTPRRRGAPPAKTPAQAPVHTNGRS